MGKCTTVNMTGEEGTFLSGAVAGTQAASKAVVADANVNTGVSKVTELHIGASGSETQVNATATEINKYCDESAKAVVSATAATLALTQALHANKIVTIDRAAGVAFTLPEATGTGDVYTLVLGTAMTSGSTTVTTADTTNADFAGCILMVDLDAATTAYIAQTIQATGDDIFTMNRTTTGGVNVGLDWVSFTDIKADLWKVDGTLYVPAGSNPATPFSGT